MIQREFHRIDLASPVRLLLGPQKGIEADCCNISMGGLCVLSEVRLEPGQLSKIRLPFTFDGKDYTFMSSVKTKWCYRSTTEDGKWEAGLFFYDLTQENKCLLVMLILQIINGDGEERN
ncbi:MAG: PilZ domain-containing protein [Fibrobacteria bacterium]|nr:PilZ domain-containing protein [Fibrobacteria bacterium]